MNCPWADSARGNLCNLRPKHAKYPSNEHFGSGAVLLENGVYTWNYLLHLSLVSFICALIINVSEKAVYLEPLIRLIVKDPITSMKLKYGSDRRDE